MRFVSKIPFDLREPLWSFLRSCSHHAFPRRSPSHSAISSGRLADRPLGELSNNSNFSAGTPFIHTEGRYVHTIITTILLSLFYTYPSRLSHPFSSPQPSAAFGHRSHTLAHVRTSGDVGPTFPTRCATQHVATRLRTCDLPLWQANRYLAKKSNEDWPVGTGTRPSRVCFVGPTWQGGM